MLRYAPNVNVWWDECRVEYQRRGQLNEGEASVLARLLVLDEANVAGCQVRVRRQGRHDGFHGGHGSNVS